MPFVSLSVGLWVTFWAFGIDSLDHLSGHVRLAVACAFGASDKATSIHFATCWLRLLFMLDNKCFVSSPQEAIPAWVNNNCFLTRSTSVALESWKEVSCCEKAMVGMWVRELERVVCCLPRGNCQQRFISKVMADYSNDPGNCKSCNCNNIPCKNSGEMTK